MKRRTNFQYGSLLDKGGKGSLSVGIGLTPSSGTTTYISPSYEVKKATETIKVDGVEMVFQLTPNTESPAVVDGRKLLRHNAQSLYAPWRRGS